MATTDTCAQTSLLAWVYLTRVYDKLQHHAANHLVCYDLTPAQYGVLAQLSDTPGMSQQTLAQRLLVTKGNVCSLIDRMSAHGLVERRPDSEDRRINLLYLTEEGQRAAETAVPAYAEFVSEHLAGLTTEEQRTLQALLTRLDTFLDQHE